MSFPERRTANILLTILFFGVVCAAIYSARRVLLLFVFAIFFAYLIDPVVKFLQRHSLFFKSLRGPAVVEVYLASVALIALLGYTLAPGVARNAVKWMDEIPVLLNGLSTGEIASDLKGQYDWTEEQEFRLRGFLASHQDEIQRLVPTVDRYLSKTVQVLGWLLLAPVLAIFFLRDGDHIANILIQLFFPANQRPRIRAVANDLHLMLTSYIRAQVLLCVLSFLFYSGVLLLLQFPHAIALGTLGGLLEFVPVAGWISTLAVLVGVGVVHHSHWIWMAVLLSVWRVVQDYFTLPRIMASQVKIHPLAAIFAVLVGAEIGGIVGVYLAIPLVASMRVIWRVCAEEPVRLEPVHPADISAEAPSRLVETSAI